MAGPVAAGPATAKLEGAAWIIARRIDEDELIEHFTLYPEEHELLRDKSGVGRLGFRLILKYPLTATDRAPAPAPPYYLTRELSA